MINLPVELLNKLNINNIELPEIGYSDDHVYFLNKGYEGKDVVIKYSNRIEVYEEGLALIWLKDRFIVPEVYINECIHGVYYLVMEKLNGRMMHEMIFNDGIENGIIKYALLINEIHQIPIDDFPNNQSLVKRVKEASENVKNGFVKEQFFEREIKGKSAKEVFTLMLDHYPLTVDEVFIHGDVCMPNFIYDDSGQFLGMIDVGRSGVSDRYIDLAVAIRSLRYNLELYGQKMNKSHVHLFLKSYGLIDFDANKFKFYFLLDELINN